MDILWASTSSDDRMVYVDSLAHQEQLEKSWKKFTSLKEQLKLTRDDGQWYVTIGRYILIRPTVCCAVTFTTFPLGKRLNQKRMWHPIKNYWAFDNKTKWLKKKKILKKEAQVKWQVIQILDLIRYRIWNNCD